MSEDSLCGGAVSAVEPGSIAAELHIRPGDVLVSINGRRLRDVLDVQFYTAEETLELLVRRGRQEFSVYAERDYDRPLGLDFTSPVFDHMRLCDNRCEFCFVAQMPPSNRHLRRSLYLRDDDYRYSVLYGSFITLTNLTQEDWQRIEEQRLAPLYISVHATEPDLRGRLLGRDGLPDILEQIDRLADLGIEMHTQIVLIPGLNDGAHLLRTVTDLAARYPAVQSIGIVPVGLTRYHRGLCRTFTPQEALAVIEQIKPLQKVYRKQHNSLLVYLADEWYLMTGTLIPSNEDYDDYPQIENGIGLVRQFLEDSRRLRIAADRGLRTTGCTLVCGVSIAPVIQAEARKLAEKTGIQFGLAPVVNQLFGETVTVSGLLGGEEVIAALQGRELGKVVCLPRAMFDEAGERTLDDLTMADLAVRLGRPVIAAGLMSEVWEQLVRLSLPKARSRRRRTVSRAK